MKKNTVFPVNLFGVYYVYSLTCPILLVYDIHGTKENLAKIQDLLWTPNTYCFTVEFENLRKEKCSVESKYLCTGKNPVAICSQEPSNRGESSEGKLLTVLEKIIY